MLKENKNTRNIIIASIITILLVGGLTATFAYLSIGGKQTGENAFSSGCLNISIESESNAINLSNVYPITDIEGLSSTPYTFTIKNTCSTPTNYQINLESLNQTSNTLDDDYVKVSLSSDTNGNIISLLKDNPSVTPTITGAYQSNNLYTGTISGNTSKTFNLRIWLDYNTTVEQGESKVYTSKINVIANPDLEVNENEIAYTLNSNTLTGTITGTVSSVSYCIESGSTCIPNTSIAPTGNTITIELDRSKDQIVCTSINSGKVICSDNIPKLTAKDIILADNIIDTSRKSGSFSSIYTANTAGKIFEGPADDYGTTTYFYAGANPNNWVKFGKNGTSDTYWRIIRINGDGSVRMIYSGRNSPTAAGSDTRVNTVRFNSNYNNNAYVGFMYKIGEVRGLATNSTVKETLDNWYINSFIHSEVDYEKYIALNVGFCGDRTPSTSKNTSNGLGGTGSTETYYSNYITHENNLNVTYKCGNTSDIFTTGKDSIGNNALTYPVGLITANEVAFAGGKMGTNNENYWLYTREEYWTMSPSYFNGYYAHAFYVSALGNLGAHTVDNIQGVRPVINLKADILLTGSGTTSDPYVVS